MAHTTGQPLGDKQSPRPARAERYVRDTTLLRGAAALLLGAWDGLRLRCPACGEGRLYDPGSRTTRPACAGCGAPFERANEADFLGAMVLTYALTALVALSVILAINAIGLDVPMGVQITAVGAAALVFIVLCYRNVKGVWVAILIGLEKWLR